MQEIPTYISVFKFNFSISQLTFWYWMTLHQDTYLQPLEKYLHNTVNIQIENSTNSTAGIDWKSYHK